MLMPQVTTRTVDFIGSRWLKLKINNKQTKQPLWLWPINFLSVCFKPLQSRNPCNKTTKAIWWSSTNWYALSCPHSYCINHHSSAWGVSNISVIWQLTSKVGLKPFYILQMQKILPYNCRCRKSSTGGSNTIPNFCRPMHVANAALAILKWLSFLKTWGIFVVAF